MKTAVTMVLLLCVVTFAVAADEPALREHIVIQKLQGDVTVRHGVMEGWTQVATGDVLRPDDSMKIGRKGTAVLLVQMMKGEMASTKRISLPPR